MATPSIDQMRMLVAGLYPGGGWKLKVARMPDSQVAAIYFKANSEGKFDPGYKKPDRGRRIETNPVDDFGGVQLTFDDIL